MGLIQPPRLTDQNAHELQCIDLLRVRSEDFPVGGLGLAKLARLVQAKSIAWARVGCLLH